MPERGRLPGIVLNSMAFSLGTITFRNILPSERSIRWPFQSGEPKAKTVTVKTCLKESTA